MIYRTYYLPLMPNSTESILDYRVKIMTIMLAMRSRWTEMIIMIIRWTSTTYGKKTRSTCRQRQAFLIVGIIFGQKWNHCHLNQSMFISQAIQTQSKTNFTLWQPYIWNQIDFGDFRQLQRGRLWNGAQQEGEFHRHLQLYQFQPISFQSP